MAKMNLNVGIRNLKKQTNILSIKVPDALRHKKATGVSWFDDALGGEGFTPSTSMMLTGGPGCGKTTMLLQIADAITAQGHIALLNTGEESLYQVRMNAINPITTKSKYLIFETPVISKPTVTLNTMPTSVTRIVMELDDL
jgi:predicted ATP-dependent serine protease